MQYKAALALEESNGEQKDNGKHLAKGFNFSRA